MKQIEFEIESFFSKMLFFYEIKLDFYSELSL